MSANDEIVRVYSDPVGAASVMREVVTRPRLSAQLIENGGGRWQVVIRADAATDRFLVRILDLLLGSLNEGRLQFATVEYEGRTIELGRPDPAMVVG
jgi:hypothetical protein